MTGDGDIFHIDTLSDLTWKTCLTSNTSSLLIYEPQNGKDM